MRLSPRSLRSESRSAQFMSALAFFKAHSGASSAKFFCHRGVLARERRAFFPRQTHYVVHVVTHAYAPLCAQSQPMNG
ncbi:hypothetical protein AL072_24950 [Azospirillum thiophilum]|uniref:Uncharacterized protein n=1 Tax=Azospirillum thiophilum TaxID=528244 RepID=A0AAC8ZVZ9_9PROT|nr:hypothetical protein AL072_24950 [Azospirillum thiophilum]